MKNPIPGIINELRQVKWPTPKELLGLLVYVVVISSILALLMLGLDYFFTEVRQVLLNL